MRFGADGLTAALGYYLMTAAQLERYRHAVDDETGGARLAGMVERLRAQGVEVGGGRPSRTPRADTPKIIPGSASSATRA